MGTICKPVTESLIGEPDVWESRLSGSERGRGTTMKRKTYCGTVAKADGNGENKPHPTVKGVSCLLTKKYIQIILFVSLLCGRCLAAGETVSLEGKWRFAIDQSKVGVSEEWFKKDLSDSIKLPGTMDDAGLGPKNTAIASLAGPRRVYDYAGPAWYQCDIEIPEQWKGKRVTLFLERCRWVTTVWLDDKLIGSHDSLISPHLYDFGNGVTAGKHRLTICVDNTLKINLGVFVSALKGGTPGNMNGIIGRIELAATPPVWLAEVQVYPDIDRKIATVKVRIANSTGKAGTGELGAGEKKITVKWDEKGGQAEVAVDMSQAKLWDEFVPNLSDVKVTLDSGNGAIDERRITFGMRKFVAEGTQFCMNGRPVFLRGTLECQVFPVTGYPPMDIPAWQKIYRTIKSYGLNHMRFHSWCPPEAAFAAADIEGVMLQVEGPVANVASGMDRVRDAFIEAEFKRIVDTYGNHPSFCTMALGNEWGGKQEFIDGWVGMLIQRDSRHLYSSASNNRQVAENRQFTVSVSGRGVRGPGTAGDLSKVVIGDSHPVIGHEIGQWMFFPNFEEMEKYTGVMKVDNFDIIRNDLKAKGLFDQYPEIYQAVGRQAILLYKEEMELLLRTPGYAGFQLLDLHDYPTQGTALIGLLDPFWGSKGFITPEQHRQYCSAVVPLLRVPKRTYTLDESFVGVVDIANYGAKDLKDINPQWSIHDEAGHEIAVGTLEATNAPTGKLTSLGSIATSLAMAKAPCKLTVRVSLKGTKFANEWEIWAYPAAVQTSVPADVVVCRRWDEAASVLADGKKVLLFPDKLNPALSMKGKFMPVFWSPVWFQDQKPNTMSILCDPKHPAFASFPTEFYSNWQWYSLLNNSQVITLNETPIGFRPVVQVIDNFARNNRMGCVFEARVGRGRLLLCTIKLPEMAETNPEARQLLKSIYDYMGSDKFNPAVELTPELMDKICSPNVSSQVLKLGAKVVSVDSQDPAHQSSNAIDGDASTIWHTSWAPKEDPMPHQIVIDLGREVGLKGFTYLPRQDTVNGRIAEYEMFVGNDDKNFGEPVAKGKWKSSDDLQTVMFGYPVNARYLKFVARAGVQGKPFAAVAELDVVLDEKRSY